MDRYNGTTKEQRKMARAIAADVLKTMRYLDIRGNYHGYLRIPPTLVGEPVQDVPLKRLRECTVCARGAIFISRCRLYNHFAFPANPDAGDVVCSTTALDIGETNAGLIENAFEGDASDLADVLSKFFSGTVGWQLIYAAAIVFGSLFQTDTKRLRAIMQNALSHAGVFRPDKDPRVIKRLNQAAKENAAKCLN